MERRRFGPTKRQVPVIGQGTWYIDNGNRVAAIAALRLGLDLEEMVGVAIAGRRDEVFLVSKVLPQNASFSGTIAACERSLARLDTDWLDCYLVHGRRPIPAGGHLRGLRAASAPGKNFVLGGEQFR